MADRRAARSRREWRARASGFTGPRRRSEKAWPIPDAYRENRYFVLAHGVGMTGEYP
jgi:hypothetical protein